MNSSPDTKRNPIAQNTWASPSLALLLAIHWLCALQLVLVRLFMQCRQILAFLCLWSGAALCHAQDTQWQSVFQFLVSWVVFDLSHCRKLARDFEVPFVECHVVTLR